ncbi:MULTISPECIES: type II toxin-antitoxin system Phd/YefM family antitoxin [unclassified Streptomyces]|uniref:antitoxin VbhA family protein n=1 Tax=unclassified Streptomyces TaxID=2593676 RepID=UPI002E2A8E47|nr:type II toxin-antitoxin system Phd/YefM family antitoxin [Streptomyces sp. NBC_00223]
MEIPEIVTVSDARAGLSRILAELSDAGRDADPVVIGAHRKPQGVLLSIEAYEELTGRAARRQALASAAASVEAEGLHISESAIRDGEAYVRGELDAGDLVARAISRHRHRTDLQAG